MTKIIRYLLKLSAWKYKNLTQNLRSFAEKIRFFHWKVYDHQLNGRILIAKWSYNFKIQGSYTEADSILSCERSFTFCMIIVYSLPWVVPLRLTLELIVISRELILWSVLNKFGLNDSRYHFFQKKQFIQHFSWLVNSIHTRKIYKIFLTSLNRSFSCLDLGTDIKNTKYIEYHASNSYDNFA